MIGGRIFPTRLLSGLLADNPAQNLFLSTASVALALGMVLAGARGATAAEIAGLLELEDNPLEGLAALTSLFEELRSDPGVQIDLASALWCHYRYALSQDYVERCRELFRASAETLDFSNPQAIRAINAWVRSSTEGKIPAIIDTLSEADRLVLTNAIYFKGAWTRGFNPAQTREETFHLPGGAACPVPMMALRAERLSYTETAEYQAISLPYGERRRVVMDIALPRPGRDAVGLLRALSASGWDTVTRGMTRQSGSLRLPRFRAQFSAGLIPALRVLGIRRAFEPQQADLTAMGPGGLFISAVLHSAVIETNEHGTEAAASTRVSATLSAMVAPPRPFLMQVDRPFLCALRDQLSGAILFLGLIVDPRS